MKLKQNPQPKQAAAVDGIYANHTAIPENMGKLLGARFKCIQYGSSSKKGATGNSDLLCLIMFAEDDIESIYQISEKIGKMIEEA